MDWFRVSYCHPRLPFDYGPQDHLGTTSPTSPAGPASSTCVAGPTSPTGLAGPTGPVGSTSPTGHRGPPGPTGIAGPSGVAGLTGPTPAWPGSGVLGTRRAQSGLQLAPGTRDVAWEWCSGKMHRDSGPEFHTFQRYDFLCPSLARTKRT